MERHTCPLIALLPMLLLASVGVQSGQAQDGKSESAVKPIRQFPFEMTETKIFVQVSLNDSKPLQFILDTGCPGAFVIDHNRANAVNLKLKNVREVHTGAGEGRQLVAAVTSDAVTLNVHGEKLTVQSAQVLQLDHTSQCFGRRVDGLLGNRFLGRYVLEIDYASNVIKLYEPRAYKYNGTGWSIPFSMQYGWVITSNEVTVPGQAAIDGRFVVDTGANCTVFFTRPFVERNKLLVAGMKLVPLTAAGAGGNTKFSACRLSSIQLGPFLHREPIAFLSHDRSGFFASQTLDGIIGAEVLRRCRVVFDYPRRRLILEPYAKRAEKGGIGLSGMFIIAEGPDYRRFRIEVVQQHLPAAEAGAKSGDVITAINGQPAEKFTLAELRELLKRHGTECRLELQRGDEQLNITMILKRLI